MLMERTTDLPNIKLSSTSKIHKIQNTDGEKGRSSKYKVIIKIQNTQQNRSCGHKIMIKIQNTEHL